MTGRFEFNQFHNNALKTVPAAKLMGRIKMAEFLEMPEREFYRHIRKIENNPLFRKLSCPAEKTKRVISYARPYRAKLSDSFMELKEEMIPGAAGCDVESIVLEREKAVNIIKKIGEDAFKKYFLYNESGIPAGALALICGLTEEEVRAVYGFVDDLAIQSEFSGETANTGQKHISYCKIASIGKDDSGNLIILYNSCHLARGSYSIDKRMLDLLKNDNYFSENEIGGIETLIGELEFINSRKSTMHKVLENIMEFQKEFLETGNSSKMMPLTQKYTAERAGVNPSVINRIIYGKSIAARTGKEIPLKEFFLSKKYASKNLIKEIVAAENYPLRDEAISGMLSGKFGFSVTRHLVQIYRKELGIPPAGKRKKL